MEQTQQEARNKWPIIRLADFSGELQPCRLCGGSARVFVVDPVGTWLRTVMKDKTFVAARCACGATGKLQATGLSAIGTVIDEPRAAAAAARSWNAENRTA